MKRLADSAHAVKQQLEAVLEGLRILAGIAQPRSQVAVGGRARPTSAARSVSSWSRRPRPLCLSCRRRLAPATAG